MNLRVRSFGFGFRHAIVLGFSLSACGPQISREQTALNAEEVAAQSYQEWCTGWKLNCPLEEPGKTPSLTAAQFRALGTILGSALSSPSLFSITRAELDDASLKQAITALKLDDIYQDVQAGLDARQWQAGRLEPGALVLNAAAPSAVRSASGLVLNLETQQRVTANAAAIQLSGVGLTADAAEASPLLKSLAVAEDGRFKLDLDDRSVAGVPQDFALDHLLGILGLDPGSLEGKEIALGDVIQAGAPLVNWLNRSSRQIALERAFFASSAPELSVLLPDDGIGKALGDLLGRFDKLRTSSDPKVNTASVALVKGATAKCDLNNGEIKLKFAAEFGVKRVYQPNATSLGLEFYGLEASAKKAFGLSIKLKRLEISADKITILDVPIIGKVDLKLEDLGGGSDQPTTLVCGA